MIVHASGFIYKMDCCSNLEFNHAQLSLGYRVGEKIGIGIGGGRWVKRDGYRDHIISGLGANVSSSSKRWVSRLEVGVLTDLTYDHYSAVFSEHFLLQSPWRDPYIRAQGGIRFLNAGLNGIAGIGLYYVPVANLKGEKFEHFGGQTTETTLNVKKSFGGLQFFIGLWVQKDSQS